MPSFAICRPGEEPNVGAVPALQGNNGPGSKKWPLIFKTGKRSRFLSEVPWLGVLYVRV
jgi:hypothetical protein